MKITIYTITDCQFSKQEKDYLAAHNLPFEERNLETNHEYLTEMLNVSNNFAGTPVTKLEKDDGSVVVVKGFTVEEFDKELGFKKEEKAAETAVAPPASPPEMPAPQPPPPAPENPAPQPAAPDEPVSPPTVPDQSAKPAVEPLPPLSVNTDVPPAPSAPVVETPQPEAAQPVVESTIDDASLDAILNQLQEKTAAPPQNNQPAAPASTPATPGTPPAIPEFGSSS